MDSQLYSVLWIPSSTVCCAFPFRCFVAPSPLLLHFSLPTSTTTLLPLHFNYYSSPSPLLLISYSPPLLLLHFSLPIILLHFPRSALLIGCLSALLYCSLLCYSLLCYSLLNPPPVLSRSPLCSFAFYHCAPTYYIHHTSQQCSVSAFADLPGVYKVALELSPLHSPKLLILILHPTVH